MKTYCENCQTKVKKAYRVNIFMRDPTHKYHGSGLPFISTENRLYCKVCFIKITNKIKKII